MNISTLQSLIRRNATEIHNTECQIDFYTKDCDGVRIKLFKDEMAYIGKLKKDIVKLAKIQKELKAEICLQINDQRDLQKWMNTVSIWPEIPDMSFLNTEKHSK